MAGTGYQINLLEVELWGRQASHKTADCTVQFTIVLACVCLPLIYLPSGLTSPFPPTPDPPHSPTKKTENPSSSHAIIISRMLLSGLLGEGQVKRAKGRCTWAQLFCAMSLSSGAPPEAMM